MSENIKKIPDNFLSDERLLRTLLNLPLKILRNHDVEGLPHIILHEIAHANHVGFKRAYYFVDNPDFACMKGVACFCNEHHNEAIDPWHDPQTFVQNVQQSPFYDEMQKFVQHNVEREKGACKIDALSILSKKLGMNEPQVFTWDMRHGNKGILIYEEGDKQWCRNNPELLDHISALLGLCPL